jgi:hypothetical protein
MQDQEREARLRHGSTNEIAEGQNAQNSAKAHVSTEAQAGGICREAIRFNVPSILVACPNLAVRRVFIHDFSRDAASRKHPKYTVDGRACEAGEHSTAAHWAQAHHSAKEQAHVSRKGRLVRGKEFGFAERPGAVLEDVCDNEGSATTHRVPHHENAPNVSSRVRHFACEALGGTECKQGAEGVVDKVRRAFDESALTLAVTVTMKV